MPESLVAEAGVGFEFSEEIDAYLASDEHKLIIDDTNIDREMSLQAARYIFYADKSVYAEREYDLMKHTINKVRAEVDKKIRAKYLSEGAKLPSVAAIESEIDSNPGVVALELKLIDLKGRRDVLKNLKEAMWMRKDLLLRMAINKRNEMESLRDSTVKERAVV